MWNVQNEIFSYKAFILYILHGYIKIIGGMYGGAVKSVRLKLCLERCFEFPIWIGLHQACSLGSYLFALVVDNTATSIQDRILLVYVVCRWCGT